MTSVNDQFSWNNFDRKPGKPLPEPVNQREARKMSEGNNLLNTSKPDVKNKEKLEELMKKLESYLGLLYFYSCVRRL